MRVVIFGEDDNDREALRELVMALCPASAGRVEKRKKPLLLAKNAPSPRLSDRARKLAATVRADVQLRGEVACVFVHEDADDIAPADATRARAMEEAAVNTG